MTICRFAMPMIAVALLMSCPSPAWADSNRVYGYLGGAAGTANGKFSFPGLADVDDDAVSYDFFGGVSLNRYLAVEGGISDFGVHEDDFPAIGVSSETSVASRYLAVMGKWPVSELISLYGKAGISFWEVEQTFRGSTGFIRDDDSANDFYWAIGARYDLDDYLALTGEYRQLSMEPEFFGVDTEVDIRSLAIGLALAF